jgi:solute carrier family 25 2-oxodicarboxylate transporter 21
MLMHIYRTEGLRALYRGLVPKLLRLGPGGGLLLVVYEYVNRLLPAWI